MQEQLYTSWTSRLAAAVRDGKWADVAASDATLQRDNNLWA